MVRTVSSLNLGHPGRSDNDEGPANMAADFGVSFLMNESGIEPWRRECVLIIIIIVIMS
jgi:hypothetical protein